MSDPVIPAPIQTNPTVSPARAKAKAAFLATLRKTCNVARSARAARVARDTVYAWREADKEFREAWEAAIDIAADFLEDVAVERATVGTLRPVYQGGVKVGEVREYSDSLLLQLLKAHKPDLFRTEAEGAGKRAGVLNIQICLDGNGPAGFPPFVAGREAELLRELPPDGPGLVLTRFAITDESGGETP